MSSRDVSVENSALYSRMTPNVVLRLPEGISDQNLPMQLHAWSKQGGRSAPGSWLGNAEVKLSMSRVPSALQITPAQVHCGTSQLSNELCEVCGQTAASLTRDG